MKVIMTGTVPIHVAVDTQTGEIDWVSVLDEWFELDRVEGHLDWAVITHYFNGYDVDDLATRRRALEIMDTTTWPAWEFGR